MMLPGLDAQYRRGNFISKYHNLEDEQKTKVVEEQENLISVYCVFSPGKTWEVRISQEGNVLSLIVKALVCFWAVSLRFKFKFFYLSPVAFVDLALLPYSITFQAPSSDRPSEVCRVK
jgi:hypothetical protein